MRIVTQQEQDRRKDGARAVSLTGQTAALDAVGHCRIGAAYSPFTCFTQQTSRETAVVTTFGRVTAVQERSGFHLKSALRNTEGEQGAGECASENRAGLSHRDGTGSGLYRSRGRKQDDNRRLQHSKCRLFVEYKISDPVKIPLQPGEPAAVLKNLVQSQVRSVIGATEVDAVLTTGRSEVERLARRA